MVVSKVTQLEKIRFIWERGMASLRSGQNLRHTAVLTAILQMLLAHGFLFVVLLCLAHAEQMRMVLDLDIMDQKDNGFYNMSPFHNDARLKTATELADATEDGLLAMTGVAVIYDISTIFLFMGVYRNRAFLIVPWLALEFMGMIAFAVIVVMLTDTKLACLFGGAVFFVLFWSSMLFLNGCKWVIMHTYYRNLRAMDKLQEIATVAIPLPAPGAIPYQYRRENMYLGSNGYKHILTECPDGKA